MYHYAGNNPVKYTDPDGREIYSYKYNEKKYGFCSDSSVINVSMRRVVPAITSGIGGTLANFVGGIAGSCVGEGIIKSIDNVCGFREIDTSSSTLDRLNSSLGNISNIAGDFDKIKGLKGSYFTAAANIAKTAKIIGTISTAIDVGSPLFFGTKVAKDSLIDRLFGKSLSSTSHENVSALYIYAKMRIEDLINTGDLKFQHSWDGELNQYSYNKDSITQLRDELYILKLALEE